MKTAYGYDVHGEEQVSIDKEQVGMNWEQVGMN